MIAESNRRRKPRKPYVSVRLLHVRKGGRLVGEGEGADGAVEGGHTRRGHVVLAVVAHIVVKRPELRPAGKTVLFVDDVVIFALLQIKFCGLCSFH
jgi:hypothetical protein